MKRITVEQSHQLVPYSDDLINGGIEYFTITPSPQGNGWEDVHYFTSRKTNQYSNRDGDGDSWVYILTNSTMPGLIKIGSTSKDPNERAKQISRGTGVPVEFDVKYAYRCFNAERLERELHKYFKSYRTNNKKEFFQLDLDKARYNIKKLGKKYL
tara:strand:+ start:664 stop:1128 length:465 start_codon:yes stop_codon:yes gene_type:complete